MTVKDLWNEFCSDKPDMVVKTSGSTGTPKELVVSKDQMRASALSTIEYLGLKPGNNILLCMPLQYIAGTMMVVRAIVGNLNLIEIEPCGNPLEKTPPDISIDLLAITPMQLYNILMNPQTKKLLASVTNVIIGGGAIPLECEEQLIHYPNKIYATYGMTETLSHIALRRLSGNSRQQYFSPLPGVEVKLNNNRQIIINYKRVCDKELITNDIGEIAPNGKDFIVLGRIDNTICSGGIKLQTETIEKKLEQQIHVPFAISWCKDVKFGQAVCLVLEDSEKQPVNLDILDRYEKPKHIIYATIPLTGTGKKNRSELHQICEKHVNYLVI